MIKIFLQNTAQKVEFSIIDFFSKCDQIQFPTDLVTFTKEILSGETSFFVQRNNKDVFTF